jgi:hypothetical protein
MPFRHFLTLVSAALFVWGASRTVGAQSFCSCHSGCQHCVDGICIPSRSTYGYYQPRWRPWPSPLAARPTVREAEGLRHVPTPELELPTPELETELNPPFPHRMERPSATPPPGDDPFRDEPDLQPDLLTPPEASDPQASTPAAPLPNHAQPIPVRSDAAVGALPKPSHVQTAAAVPTVKASSSNPLRRGPARPATRPPRQVRPRPPKQLTPGPIPGATPGRQPNPLR